MSKLLIKFNKTRTSRVGATLRAQEAQRYAQSGFKQILENFRDEKNKGAHPVAPKKLFSATF